VACLDNGIIGQSPLRREDERFVTGRGRFVDDIAPAGLLHVAIVRSAHARARSAAIDTAGARALPGVSVFVAGDLPELDAPLPAHYADPGNPYVRLDTPRAQPPFASGEVRYVGEPLAAVVAPDAYAAADAAEVVRVEYEARAAVVDAESAMRDGASGVHDGLPNIVGHVSLAIGDVERAFAAADVIIEDHPRYGRVSSMAMETRGVCAQFDSATQTMTVWAGHQAPYAVRSTVAARLGLPRACASSSPTREGASGPRRTSIPRTC
jgi:carbon-monoxide dehydrogenase large subunit